MGLPGQRRSSSSKRRRAAHFALTRRALTTCPKCKKSVPPHQACPSCGTYRGRTVIEPKVVRRLRRQSHRQRKEQPGQAQ